MISQLSLNLQASQAVHGADDVATQMVPKLILLFTTGGRSSQPYSNNFGLRLCLKDA